MIGRRKAVRTVRNVARASVAALAGFFGGGYLLQAQGANQAAEAGDFRFATRSSLAICVDVAGANASAASAAAVVRDIVTNDLNKRTGWGFIQARPVVVAGCPGPSRNIAQQFTHYLVGNSVNSYRPAALSPYFLHVYVTTSNEVSRIFGVHPVRTVPEEFTCHDGTCAEVTTGLIVEQESIGQRALLTKYLAEALGLVRPFGK